MTRKELVQARRGDDGVVHLILDRAEKRNALTAGMVAALSAHLVQFAEDEEARLILLEGEGVDFCAGADVAEMAASAHAGAEAALRDASLLGGLFVALRRHPLPVVAAVRGRALGGGCGLVLACDLVVAEEQAVFGLPEVRLGFVPAMVAALLVRKLPENRAFELAVLGRRLPAREALEWGLVNRVLAGPDFRAGVQAFVGEVTRHPASAVGLTKRLLRGIEEVPVEAAVGRAAEVNALARFTEEARRGFQAFLERPRTTSEPEPEEAETANRKGGREEGSHA